MVFRTLVECSVCGSVDYRRHVIAEMAERVAPGGQLLLANFHVHNRGVGFMEAMMDGWLVYRDDAQLRALADDIDGAPIAGAELFHDPFGNVVYLRLARR